jgi:hypothetical protein
VVICVCFLVLCSPLSLLKLILYHILYNERPFNFFTILYAKSPDLSRPQDRVTDHPQAMTRRVNSTWCRHMGPNPPRAADRWGPGCLSIFPVRACPDQTRRLQTIPLPYPLPISLSIISLRCGYPLPLSLLPHLAAPLRISTRLTTRRFGVRPSGRLRLRRPNRRPLLACYRPGPRGPKALGLAWRR